MDGKHTHQDGLYQTSDTSLATYLITEGFFPIEIDYSQPRFVFIFEDKKSKLQQYEHNYIAGKARVDPATYTRVNRKLIRTLKNQLQWAGA